MSNDEWIAELRISKTIDELFADNQSFDEGLHHELCPAVAAGDKAAKERMSENCLPLVAIHVKAAIKKEPRLTRRKEELFSDAYNAVADAIEKIASGETIHDHRAFIATYINNAIYGRSQTREVAPASLNAMRNGFLNKHERRAPTKRSKRVVKDANGFITCKICDTKTKDHYGPLCKLCHEAKIGSRSRYVKAATIAEQYTQAITSRDEWSEKADIIETIFNCCETEQERQIVDARLDLANSRKTTDKTVATAVGTSVKQANRCKTNVKNRFDLTT